MNGVLDNRCAYDNQAVVLPPVIDPPAPPCKPAARAPNGALALTSSAAPPTSVEAWALSYITSTALEMKLHPPPIPTRWLNTTDETRPAAPDAPGRPAVFRVAPKVARSRRGSLTSCQARNRLLHTFLHHELQAAELMAWALLRFPHAESSFRRGLLRICQDEVRHLQLYARLLSERSVAVGAYPVRDWFWERVPTCTTPLQFVSLMSLGVESANLEHSQRFAQAFEAAGDYEAAAVQRLVEEEEVSHVAFGRYWFERWLGKLDFDVWRRQLPEPLSPLLMRALPLNIKARRRAGINSEFLTALAAWTPDVEDRRAEGFDE